MISGTRTCDLGDSREEARHGCERALAINERAYGPRHTRESGHHADEPRERVRRI